MKTVLTHERVLPFAVELVWPVLSDTAGMNRKLGLAPMSFTTKAGVRYGKQRMLGTELEWTEEPWEWRQHAWLINERVYRNGLFKSIQGRFEVTPLGTQSRVTLSFTPIYRFPLLAPLLAWATKRLLRQLMEVIESTIREQQNQPPKVLPELDLASWLKGAQEFERAKIAPKEVAGRTQRNWQQVFKEALGRPELGLRFEAVCPHCRGGKQSAARLTELPEKVFCESCEIDFAVNTQDSIEVSFRDNTISPAMIGMDFCSADVTHRPAIICQRRGPQWREALTLAPGVYSLKLKGESRSIAFQVEELLASEEWVIDELWKLAPKESMVKTGPRLTLVARQLPGSALVMLEQLSKVRGALFVPEVLAIPEFERLMPAEALITSFPLEMGERCVLFTDVVGSTDMYYQLGDAVAFQRVRESFLLIGEIAQRNHGVLVKTIGDATMYAFMNPADALKTAIELQVTNRSREVKLRVTLHQGPCLSVGTRDGQDYFGDTINVCAKFQAVAAADQVAFDRTLKERIPAPLWQELVGAHRLEEVPFAMKGNPPRSFELLRLTL